jgi:uncharacterized protein
VVVRRHQLAAFFVLTFAISWTLCLGLAAASVPITTTAGAVLNVLAIAGPSLAALLLTIGMGRRALREMLAGFSVSRLRGPWWAVALILPLLMMMVAIAVAVALLGVPAPHLTGSLLGVVLLEFVRILFLGGPLGEELGWRGLPCRGCSSATRH